MPTRFAALRKTVKSINAWHDIPTLRAVYRVPQAVQLVEVVATCPSAPDEQWERVAECGFVAVSGRLDLTNPTAFAQDGPSLTVLPGTYRPLIYAGGLDTVDPYNDTIGEDPYHIVLSPEPATDQR